MAKPNEMNNQVRNTNRKVRRVSRCCAGLFALFALPMLQAVAEIPEKVTFDDHVFPIFREHCLACHDQGGRSGDLSLENYSDTMTGGASGDVVEPGAGGSSRLYMLMAHIEEPIMPPAQDKLPEEQLNLVKAWIDGGLLENAGSKAKKSSKPAVAAFVPSADNRPAGEPAMPGGFYREPVIRTSRLDAVADVAASPWAPLVAVTGQRQVLLYHTDSRELLAAVPFVVGAPEVVRFSRNGDLLLVAGGRGASLGIAHLWDIKTGQRISELGDELDTVLAADISADHTLVAIGGPRKRVQVFRTADGSLAHSLTKHTDWITALEFSPDGKLLATADRSGNAHLWEADTGRPVAAMTGHKGAIGAVSWRGDSQLLATAGDKGEVRTWQRGGNQAKQWGAGPSVQDVVFTKDGRLITVGRDRVAKLWNTDGKELKQLGQTDDIALTVCATHDDQLAVFADWAGQVRVAKIESGEEVGRLSINPPTLVDRLAAAEGSFAEVAKRIAPAEQSLAAATMTLDNAKMVVTKHNEAKQVVTQALAKLEQERKAVRGKLTEHRHALEQLDKSLATVSEEQKSAYAQLAELQGRLAGLGNQEDEQADGEQVAKLEAEIAEKEKALATIVAKRTATEAKRPQLAEQRKVAKQAVNSFKNQIGKQKGSLAEMSKREATLPNLQALTTERDRLKRELDGHHAAKSAAEQRVTELKQEIAAYAAAEPTLSAKLTEEQKAVESQTGELKTLNEKLAAEAAMVEAAAKKLAELKKQVAELESKRQELAGTAMKSEEAVQLAEESLGELSAEREKTAKAVFDLREAVELRKRISAGN